MFQSISENELISAGAIFAENVEDALRQYHSVILKGDKLCMSRFLKRCLEENPGQAFADFYYAVLTPEQQRAFAAGLSEEEKDVFSQFEVARGQVYYPLREENLDFLSEITARGWLFSTFFFAEYKATVWGNYNMEYPLFCEEAEILEFYKNIAVECGLELL